MKKPAFFIAWISSIATIFLLIVFAVKAISPRADANAFLVMAFISLLAIPGVLATWKRDSVLMFFSSMLVLPFGLWVLWAYEGAIRLVGIFNLLFLMTSLFLLVVKHTTDRPTIE